MARVNPTLKGNRCSLEIERTKMSVIGAMMKRIAMKNEWNSSTWREHKTQIPLHPRPALFLRNENRSWVNGKVAMDEG
jgi:hypothetical protein